MENNLMKPLICSVLIFLSSNPVAAALYVTIIQGLDGTPQYHQQFSEQTAKLKVAAETITAKNQIQLFSSEQATRDNILLHFDKLKDSISEQDRVAVFLIGHGSYDGYEYKFNIPGPDITAEDIAVFMDALPAGIQLLVNTSSASGVLNDGLKNDSRILVTATRNGNERLATRFGAYFFDALEDPSADINKNNSITVQEAFDYADRQVKDYFETQGQLATEHAVISGIHAGQFAMARSGLDQPTADNPELSNLISERNEIDIKIEDLQLRKAEMDADEFLNRLQGLMIDLSMIQEKIDEFNQGDNQ
jgi:hypothetical protein